MSFDFFAMKYRSIDAGFESDDFQYGFLIQRTNVWAKISWNQTGKTFSIQFADKSSIETKNHNLFDYYHNWFSNIIKEELPISSNKHYLPYQNEWWNFISRILGPQIAFKKVNFTEYCRAEFNWNLEKNNYAEFKKIN